MKGQFIVLVADPSAYIREQLVARCRSTSSFHRVEWATSPEFLERKIKRCQPHLVVANMAFLVDVQSPPADFRIALHLEGDRPDLTLARHRVMLPRREDPDDMLRFVSDLEAALRDIVVRLAKVTSRRGSLAVPAKAASYQSGRIQARLDALAGAGGPLIAIGASTGGTIAIEQLLKGLYGDGPPVVIAQHISSGFSRSFARRLDSTCAVHVIEGQDKVPLQRGYAYLAPADRHLAIDVADGTYCCLLGSEERINGHCPSVDHLFTSVARVARGAAIGILLTGMGRDGAEGLLAMRRQNARTFAQDEATSVVWGMPGAAEALGAAQHVLPLERIAEELADLYMGKRL